MTLASPPLIASTLRALTETLAEYDLGEPAGGILGGEFGYGAEFSSTTFTMQPYWWGDDDCGFEERESAFEAANGHEPGCYQSELERRQDAASAEIDDDISVLSEISTKLAREWGLPDVGCAVHCTCDYDERRTAWLATADGRHDAGCRAAAPNFRHHPTGIEVRWYKFIGRSMEVSRDIDFLEWLRVITDCVAAVRNAAVEIDDNELERLRNEIAAWTGLDISRDPKLERSTAAARSILSDRLLVNREQRAAEHRTVLGASDG